MPPSFPTRRSSDLQIMSRSPRYAVDPAGEPRNLLTPRHLTKQEFGRRLYQLMLAKNWSQADLARRAELGRDSISTYINGKTFPDPQIGRAHVCTPVTNAHLVCRLLLETQQTK